MALVEQLNSQQHPRADGSVASASALADSLPAQMPDTILSVSGLIEEGLPDLHWEQPHLENDDQAWQYCLSLVEDEYQEF